MTFELSPVVRDGMSAQEPQVPDDARTFLVRVAQRLHEYGTPANRLERVLAKVASSQNLEASFFATPTSVFVSFGELPDVKTYLLRVESGEVDLGKLIEFDEVMEDVEHGRATPEEGTQRVQAIAAAEPRYHRATTTIAFGVASAAAACFFGAGLFEIGLTFLLGTYVSILGRSLSRNPAGPGVFELAAAFSVALLSLVGARLLHPYDDRVVTLASLIVLLPGLTLTVAMNELATRHVVSGTARLAGGAATLLTILLGVALAWRIGDALLPPAAAEFVPAGLPAWTQLVALAAAPFAFAVLFEARLRELGVIWVTGVLGYGAARLGVVWLGADLGAFAGALVVGMISNIYARRCDRPSTVPMTPAILLLVPGSLGYRSLTSFLERDSLGGAAWAFQTGLVAISLVGGLLAANLLVPPRRVL